MHRGRNPKTDMLPHERNGQQIADVYSGDIDVSDAPKKLQRFLFLIEADADPDIFSRVAGLFSLSNRPIEGASVERRHPESLHFAIEIGEVSLNFADSLCRKLMQLTSVHTVECRRVDEGLQHSDTGGQYQP